MNKVLKEIINLIIHLNNNLILREVLHKNNLQNKIHQINQINQTNKFKNKNKVQ